MYMGQHTDVSLSFDQNATLLLRSAFIPVAGIVYIWSDGRCYSPGLDAYVLPTESDALKSLRH